jgi:uncharacterized membrane protein required for colicin V production
MVSLPVLFWMFVILFAIIGASRGWAKEILVTFSAVLALFIVNLMQTYVPFFLPDSGLSPATRFWVQSIVIGGLAFFGYQTANIRAIVGERLVRERLQDTLLGLIIGALNGYLIIGTIWFFMDRTGYPLLPYIAPPDSDDTLGRLAISMVEKMPPAFLQPPWVYFAVAVAFLFVVIVFV